MTARGDIEEALRHIGSDAEEDFDLAQTALLLAALDRPRVSLDRYRDHLAAIAEGVAGAQGTTRPSAGDCHAALTGILSGTYGYRGDDMTYDDLQNANLMRVIDRRKGLPVALGILYIHAARAQGWSIVGLNFPGHFLVRLDNGGERIILDPFNNGCAREPSDLRDMLQAMSGQNTELTPEIYAPVTNREILLRLQSNVRLRLLQMDRTEEAIGVIESMLLFAPDQKELWREAGLLHAQFGNPTSSIAALEEYLSRETHEAPRHEAAAILQQLRHSIN
ncbi:MAG: transglutaminase-like domain-containing protein [Rhodospirillales bacterium]|jgi:regulator of sirC expression with transglutaminase-like and TPR domain|nr:transglutaminase-like domain-containing protein [Rhodospirillales bacterium]